MRQKVAQKKEDREKDSNYYYYFMKEVRAKMPKKHQKQKNRRQIKNSLTTMAHL